MGERAREKNPTPMCFFLLLVLFPETEEKAEICSFHIISGAGALKETSTMRLMIKSSDLATVHSHNIHF